MTAQLAYTHNGCTTEWHCGRGIASSDRLAAIAAKHGRRPVIISDIILKDTISDKLASFIDCKAVYIEAGEKAKTAKTKEKVENLLLKEGYGTDTVIIAVGGGTVTDMVGYVASTYLRGVPLILIPSTLMAIVDASIGGKNGINTKYGKNLIGTLYPPKAIFADLDLLKTLPASELAYGMAEIVKIGLASNRNLLLHLGDRDAFDDLVRNAVKEKIRIVEQNSERNKIRHILNFGHTIAHGLEYASGYTLAHGTAVAIGCMTEAYLSMRLGHLPQKSFADILPLSAYLGTMSLPSAYSRRAVLKALANDKKNTKDGIRFVCLEAIGQSASFNGDFCRKVEIPDITDALTWMEESYG